MWGNVSYLTNLKLKISAVLFISIAMSGCMETASDLNSARQKPYAQQVQAPNVPVVLVSLEGAPETQIQQLNQLLESHAKQHGIILVSENAQPRFRLKGYLSAYTAQEGTSISWVWDVYDTRLQRAQRVDGSTLVKQTNADPWAAINDATLNTVAASSMTDIAAYLATAKIETLPLPKKTPEKAAPNEPALKSLSPAIAQPNTQKHIKFSALDLRR